MKLTNLTGIKSEIIQAMADAGLTIESIATGGHDLTVYDGVGKVTAQTIVAQAKAMIEGKPDTPEWKPGLQPIAVRRETPSGLVEIEGYNGEPAAPKPEQMSERVRRAAESAGS